MSIDAGTLVTMARNITKVKYYSVATTTILFYDYLLTLADEIKYVWCGKKSWIFFLFVVNRYFPITYQVWQYAVNYGPLNSKACDSTAWYPTFVFVVCTFLAQVALTVRVYAVTTGSVPITVGFAIITASQLGLGILGIVLTVGGAAQPQVMPLDAYRTCPFVRQNTLDVAYTSMSLLYDLLAFSLIVLLAIRSKASGLRVPGILGVIAEDATCYFMVIFTSHFVFEITLTLGRDSIQLLPAPGIVVYLPVMISRMILSLRRAADPQRADWSLWWSSVDDANFHSIRFARPQNSVHRADDGVSLEAYLGS